MFISTSTYPIIDVIGGYGGAITSLKHVLLIRGRRGDIVVAGTPKGGKHKGLCLSRKNGRSKFLRRDA